MVTSVDQAHDLLFAFYTLRIED